MLPSQQTTRFFVAAHALIRHDDRYLIIRRCGSASYGAARWELPGGKVKPGETVEEALMREIEEEVGLTVELIRLMHVYTNRDSLPDEQYIEITYVCSSKSANVRLNPLEHDEYRWISLEDLRNLGQSAREFLTDLVSGMDLFISMK